MAGNSPVIVWEFQSDLPGMFAPYSDKVSNHIEDQYSLDSTGKIMLGQIEPVLKDYSIEFGRMIQTNCKTTTQRQVRRQLYDNSTVIGNGNVWQWLTDVGWITYDVETQCEIENAFNRNEEEVDLEQLQYHLPNIVLVQKGYQQNKNSNFVRPIQRRAANYKSTSGTSSVIHPVRKHPGPVPSATTSVPQSSSKNPVPTNNTASNPPSSYHLPQSHRGAGSVRNKHTRFQPSSRNPGPHRTHGTGGNPQSPVKPPPPQPQKSVEVLTYCDLTTDVAENEDCAICLLPLKDSEDDDDDDDDDDDACKKLMEMDPIVQLKKCKHSYHKSCMEAYMKQGQQNGCIQCPICKTIHGTKIGIQPPGRMEVSTNHRHSVAGYEGDGMITITYDMHSGMQGPNHPHPNTPYSAAGFPRVAYLPANEKGKKVLKLLKIAWKRKLIFTIATSTTTGRENCVVWNEIHHKTSPGDNGSGHGDPDPTYLDNIIDELKQHGVVDEDPS